MNRRRKQTINMGHPARVQKRKHKGQLFHQPDATEQNVQRLNRLMREEMSNAHEDEGAIYGPLAVAAQYAAEKLAEIHGLSDDESYAVKHWLVGRFGEQIHAFDLSEFREWNHARQTRVKALLAS